MPILLALSEHLKLIFVPLLAELTIGERVKKKNYAIIRALWYVGGTTTN